MSTQYNYLNRQIIATVDTSAVGRARTESMLDRFAREAAADRAAAVPAPTAECAYCSADVPYDVRGEDAAPAVEDDIAWIDLAHHHLPSCEWILTRAHRRDVPALTPADTAEIERLALAAAR